MLCPKCGERDATEIYSDNMMSWLHGSSIKLCRVCVIKEQLKHAYAMRDKIPKLEEELRIEMEG